MSLRNNWRSAVQKNWRSAVLATALSLGGAGTLALAADIGSENVTGQVTTNEGEFTRGVYANSASGRRVINATDIVLDANRLGL